MSQLAKFSGIAFAAALLLVGVVDADASSSRRQAEAEQARLDQACEDARQKILSVERAQLVEECVTKKFPRSDRTSCERFFADHGAAAGGRAPLYMNLPECLEAHEYRQGRL